MGGVLSLLVCLLRRKQFYNKGCTAFSIRLYTRNHHNSNFSRECLAIRIDQGIKGEDVVGQMQAIK